MSQKKEQNCFKEEFKLPILPKLPKTVLESKFPRKFTRKDLGGNTSEWMVENEGPSDDSNWLIPGIFLMSRYPFPKYGHTGEGVKKGRNKLKGIIEKGNITMFITLMEESEYRYKGLARYEKHLKEMYPKVKLVSFPTVDLCVNSFKETKKFVNEVVEFLKKGERILMHCEGGHGRTGTIAGCILSELYPELTFTHILKRIQASHDCRKTWSYSLAPQTAPQFLTIVEYIKGVNESKIDDKILVGHFSKNGKYETTDFYSHDYTKKD